MTYDQSKKLVTADKKKGKIAVTVEEGLLHFQWRNRENNNKTEDVRLLFYSYLIFKGSNLVPW